MLKKLHENLEIRLWVRDKLNTVVKNKPISKKIEVGIYNFTINQADNYGIANYGVIINLKNYTLIKLCLFMLIYNQIHILKTIDCYSD